MTRLLAALPVAAALVAALVPAPAHARRPSTRNPSVDSVHQPVVRRADYTLDVRAGGLGGEDRGRLEGWLQTLDLRYGDRVSVDGDSATRMDVRAAVARYGLLLEPVAPVTEGPLQPGFARVIVSRTIAEVPGCPDYSRPSQPEFGASTISNFGCGVNKTLAAMIANPEDLINPRAGDGSVDPRTATKAIGSYRKRPPTGEGDLKNETTKGGN